MNFNDEMKKRVTEIRSIIEKYLRYKLMLGDEEPKPTLHSQRKE